MIDLSSWENNSQFTNKRFNPFRHPFFRHCYFTPDQLTCDDKNYKTQIYKNQTCNYRISRLLEIKIENDQNVESLLIDLLKWS